MLAIPREANVNSHPYPRGTLWVWFNKGPDITRLYQAPDLDPA